MMKKLLVLLLSAMMVMSLVACGGDDTETDGADQQVENEVDVEEDVADDTTDEVADNTTDETASDDVYYMSVGDPTQLDVLEMPEIAGTTWSMAGGLADGEEFTADGLVAALELYGGTCDFVFNEDGTAQLVQGGGTLEGTYEYMEQDGMCIGALVTFNYDGGELKYACTYTEVDGVSVIVAFSDESCQNGVYLLYTE